MNVTLLPWIALIASAGPTPFATRVIEYAPAPGQYVNNGAFNDPDEALGPPEGAGTFNGNAASVVTLGGFGGSLTLAFDHSVEDDPLNPLGLDAIVFGNAFWFGSDADQRWAECATLEIARDEDGNGEVDENELWYLIPGSHIANPQGQYRFQTWDDNTADGTYPPAFASWIPAGYSGTWSTEGWMLPPEPFASVVVMNPLAGSGLQGIHGYADYSPTLVLGDLDADDIVDDPLIAPEDFYTVPDDPLDSEVTPGSGGGDAFDIAWAIDVETGLPADLPGFDFLRISNGVHAVHGALGEKSPEIDAVADVAPDPFGDHDGDGRIDLVDVAGLQNCFGVSVQTGELCGSLDRDGNWAIDLADYAAFHPRLTGPS